MAYYTRESKDRRIRNCRIIGSPFVTYCDPEAVGRMVGVNDGGVQTNSWVFQGNSDRGVRCDKRATAAL